MTEDELLGAKVPDWTPPPWPQRATLTGRYAQLDPLNAQTHGDGLFAAYSVPGSDAIWDYLPEGPHADRPDFDLWLANCEASADPLFFTITDLETGRIRGIFSLLRIAPKSGSIEVGYITYSLLLQRTRAATEAVWLVLKWAFSAGYRRFEWKCNALNAPSRRSAMRFGLSYEGVFRQATVVKGRNRDTAWYAAIDTEFAALRSAYETWLDPANFDADGLQRQRLSDLTAPILVKTG